MSISLNIEGGMETLIAAMRAQVLRDYDPQHAPPLKNPPKPFTGPDPKVTIPFAHYPHILRNIIHYADKAALLVLRTLCKLTCKLVDREYAFHIEVASDGNNLTITSRRLGRIPSLRFRGPISLGVTWVREGEVGADNPEEVPRKMYEMAVGIVVPDIWLRVPAAAVPWLNEFLKHTVTVDMDGPTMAPILPCSRAAQVGKDLYARVFVDTYPVQLIRMYPDQNGSMAHFVPFTSPHIQHNCNLERPDAAADKSWIALSPALPCDTTLFHLGVHVHPELEIDSVAAQSIARPVNIPDSLKTIVVHLAVHPPSTRPTKKSFTSLSTVFLKIFKNMRRDGSMRIYILNVHLWDHLLGLHARDRVMTLAALCHPKAAEIVDDKHHPAWKELEDVIFFVRAEDHVIDINTFANWEIGPPVAATAA